MSGKVENCALFPTKDSSCHCQQVSKAHTHPTGKQDSSTNLESAVVVLLDFLEDSSHLLGSIKQSDNVIDFDLAYLNAFCSTKSFNILVLCSKYTT